MNRKVNKVRNRKLLTFAWIAAITILTVFLIYKEQTAVLYILATLGVTGLLVVVALTDLSKHEKFSNENARINDAAAIGSGISSSRRSSQR